jgi:uncharacterized protein YbjQ (UPF0145 family)
MEGLLVLIGLITLGYLFGKLAESRHFRSIEAREAELAGLPVTTTRHPIGNRPVRESRLSQGAVVISVDFFKRVMALLYNIFGGNVPSYETLLERARREAILRMKESCPEADQIINLRIETSSISKGDNSRIGSVEVLAYGTAVFFERTV